MMQEFRSVAPEQFDKSPFRLVGKDWMLVAAEKDGRCSGMTAGWGGLGVMWGRNAAFAVIRESRFTKGLVDGSELFSLTFFDHEAYKDMYAYMGRASGRDEDKLAKSGLTLLHRDGVPYFEQASTAILCRKLCSQPIVPGSFTQGWIDGRYYADHDYHTLYIGEVLEILTR